MPRKPDIIFLEKRTQRIKRHWKGMSRIGRLGLISMIFGGIGLVTSWFFFVVQYLSVPFSIIGLILALVATTLGFVNNERWYGFWFPVIGLVVSGIGLAIAGINYGERLAWDKEQERRNSPASKIVGLWELSNSPTPTFLNFTNDGNLLFTQNSESSESVSDSINHFSSSVKNSTGNRSAEYSVSQNDLSITFRRAGRPATCEFQIQLVAERLIVDNSTSNCDQFQIVGTWQLLSQEESNLERKQIDEKLDEYQTKLKSLKSQHETLQGSLERLINDRDDVLNKLEPFESGSRPADGTWEVHARELKTLVDQVEVVESRLPKLDMAIVRLESAIRNRIRETQMKKLGLSDEDLQKLLRIKIEIDDELKTAASAGPVEDLELQSIIEEELAKRQNQIEPDKED